MIIMFENDLGWILEDKVNKFDEWLYEYHQEKYIGVREFLKSYENLTTTVEGLKTLYSNLDGKIIFYTRRDDENSYLWFRYPNFWSVLERDFGIRYIHISDILKKWLLEFYNLSASTVNESSKIYIYM